jgi:hypothetical protein
MVYTCVQIGDAFQNRDTFTDINQRTTTDGRFPLLCKMQHPHMSYWRSAIWKKDKHIVSFHKVDVLILQDRYILETFDICSFSFFQKI